MYAYYISSIENIYDNGFLFKVNCYILKNGKLVKTIMYTTAANHAYSYLGDIIKVWDDNGESIFR